jgi:heat shock protein HslJ
MVKRARWAFARAMLAGAMVAGCSATPVATPAVSIEGTTWRAVGIETLVPVGGNEPTIAFAGGRLRGSAGCNTFAGGYTLTDGHLDVGDVKATLKRCEGRVQELEQLFLRVLVGADTVSIDAEAGLTLGGAGGTVRFRAASR